MIVRRGPIAVSGFFIFKGLAMLHYEVARIKGGLDDGKFYLRNDNSGVSQLFNTEEQAETAGFKQNVTWKYDLDD